MLFELTYRQDVIIISYCLVIARPCDSLEVMRSTISPQVALTSMR